MIKPYNAVAIQANVHMPDVTASEGEVRATLGRNLKRACELIDWSARELQRTRAATMVVGFGESFLHSFPRAGGGAIKELVKICLRIPGEETEKLAAKARQYGIYIFGAAFEIDEAWGPRLFFNTGFIIDPQGKIILKYRKNHTGPYDSYTTPHDVLDEYLKKYGEESIFPVVDTPIGRLGLMICSDGFLPETARCLAMNGAEVILFPISTFEPVHQYYHLICQCRAHENNAYVVSPNLGHTFSVERPEAVAGNSLIVDYQGRTLIATGSTGETTISATIDIEALRHFRESGQRGYLPRMRTEIYLPSYKKGMHPSNRFLKEPMVNLKQVVGNYRESIDSLFDRKIYVRPSS